MRQPIRFALPLLSLALLLGVPACTAEEEPAGDEAAPAADAEKDPATHGTGEGTKDSSGTGDGEGAGDGSGKKE